MLHVKGLLLQDAGIAASLSTAKAAVILKATPSLTTLVT
jgi:hypothetical protein